MRPKIKISLTIADIIIEAVCAAIFLLVCLYLIFSWSDIPTTVATHFGISGQADSFGSKNSIFFLLPFMVVLYAALTILQKFPHIYNYAIEITEKNAEIQYKYAVKMLRVLKLIMVGCFSFIEFQTIRSALTGKNTLGILFLPVFLICLFGTLGFYIWKSLKANKAFK